MMVADSYTPYEGRRLSDEEVWERVAALHNLHDPNQRLRIRTILDGGPDAAKALLGHSVGKEELPWPDFMLSGLNRLAQKLADVPQPRVDPPVGNDSETVRKRAEKRERIVSSYDDADRMELQLPQVCRWLPGYGYGVWVIQPKVVKVNGRQVIYPTAELRDPMDCYPGEWGASQQPRELAVNRRVAPKQAKRLWPHLAGEIDRWQRTRGYAYQRTSGGAVVLEGSKWENPSQRGMLLVEYRDETGIYLLLNDLRRVVHFTPNPCDEPLFVVAKRFSFHRIRGHYDHGIGLMIAITKLNIMHVIATEDAVFTETNVYGSMPLSNAGKYMKGRNEVNLFPPGTTVQKPPSNMPYQLFEVIGRLERQYRAVVGYPVSDDAQSPNSWVTGEGLRELTGSVTDEVREYQKVVRRALEDLDRLRLEYDDKVGGDERKPLVGMNRDTPFSDTYVPSRAIRGDYHTRRKYGVFAGWDDNATIVAGIQMLSAKAISRLDFQENIHGLENLTQVNERILQDDMREALVQGLIAEAAAEAQMVAQGGPASGRAIMAMIEMLPAGTLKDRLQKYYTPEGDELSPEEEAMMEPPGDPMADLLGGGAPPDVATVMSRLTGAGPSPAAGVQTVGRL